MRKRAAAIKRNTKETAVSISLNLDGRGKSDVKTGIAFLDHMLKTLARHGYFDLKIRARGDIGVDTHHTNEDVGIALGEAFKKALGDKRGIRRFADFRAPLDEALAEVRASLDVSGRGSFHFHTRGKTKWVEHPALRVQSNTMNYTLADAKHFWESFARHAGITLHVEFVSGEQPHHLIEATFKALSKALAWAVGIEARTKGIPSTKGKL